GCRNAENEIAAVTLFVGPGHRFEEGKRGCVLLAGNKLDINTSERPLPRNLAQLAEHAMLDPAPEYTTAQQKGVHCKRFRLHCISEQSDKSVLAEAITHCHREPF